MMKMLLVLLLLSFVTGLGVSAALFALGSVQIVLAFNSIKR